MNYILPGNGVSFGYADVVDQYRQASKRLLKVYHKAFDRADKAGREKLRRDEIAWIEKKRGICGHQREALEPGHLAIAECLIAETASRRSDIESDLDEVAMSLNQGSGSSSDQDGKATTATLDKCRNGIVILTNQLLVAKSLAKNKGYYVTAITSEPYPSLSSGDVDGKNGGRVVCGFRDTYEYSKNPVAMGVQVIYRQVSYDQFVIRDSDGKLGGIHFLQPGGIQSLEDAWSALTH